MSVLMSLHLNNKKDAVVLYASPSSSCRVAMKQAVDVALRVRVIVCMSGPVIKQGRGYTNLP